MYLPAYLALIDVIQSKSTAKFKHFGGLTGAHCPCNRPSVSAFPGIGCAFNASGRGVQLLAILLFPLRTTAHECPEK